MTQTAWLLEWPAVDNMPTRYWNPKRGWMLDPHKACWFAREADATDYKATTHIHGIVRPTEHVFGLQRVPTEAEKKAQGARCGCRGVDDYCACQNVVQPAGASPKGGSIQTPEDHLPNPIVDSPSAAITETNKGEAK